jgi:hypothetical protein
MVNRLIKWLKLKILWPSRAYPLTTVIHSPGEKAGLRYFDPRSDDDFQALQAILEDDQVKRWMVNVNKLTESSYRDWAYIQNSESVLYAILDATGKEIDLKTVHGFVYLYTGLEEQEKLRKLRDRGILARKDDKLSLEISFARNRNIPGRAEIRGLISSAIRQACRESKTKVVAFIDPMNLLAHRVVEAGGFVRVSSMKYDKRSRIEDDVYLYKMVKEV